MKLSPLSQLLCGSLMACLLTSCTSGFSGNSSSCSVGCASNSGASVPSSGGSSTPIPSSAVSMNGSTSGSLFNGVPVVSLDLPNQQLVVTLPTELPLSSASPSLLIPIPQLTGSTIGFSSVGGNAGFTWRIPLTYLMHGASFLPPAQLPNGDSLATVGIPGGEMPSLGINLNNQGSLKATVYLDPSVVGLFITTPSLNSVIPFTLSIPIQLADKRTIGYVSAVPAKGQFPSGFFISVQVPNDIAAALDDMF